MADSESKDEERSNGIPLVYYEDVKKLSMEENPTVFMIDVRYSDELQKTTKIRNTVNIPTNIFAESFKLNAVDFKNKFKVEKPELNAPIITMCKRGITGEKAAQTLKAMGYSNVKLYKGSYVDWARKEGLPAP